MNLFGRLIELVYPPRCPICRSFLAQDTYDGLPASNVCLSCLAEFAALTPPFCTICSRPFDSGSGQCHICEACLRKQPFFDSIGAPYIYDGSLKTAIHLFKYEGRIDLAGFLGPLLSSFARDWRPDENDSIVMPVPLHPRRLRERGFNQSKILAGYVASELDTKLDFLSLRRIKYTMPQTGLGKAERRKNVRGAFALKVPERVSGRTVILVDDVATTGNTLNECAKILLKAEAKQVLCLVLARTANPGF